MARTPTSPISPTPVKNAMLGGILALMLGVGAAFLREYLDDTIKGKEDLDRADRRPAGDRPHPVGARVQGLGKNEVIALTDPAAPASEAYRSLRTAIQFMGIDRELHIVQVTSPRVRRRARPPRSPTSARCWPRPANACSIIDCDLRRPRLHDYFGIRNEIGFTSVLIGDTPLQDAIVRVGGNLPLFLLPSGPLPPNPSELLWTKRTTQLFSAVQAQFDICLIDSPPVLPVTDPVVIAKSADAVVLVASAGVTTRKQLHRAVELLRQVDAPLEGMVLNKAGDAAGYGYSYRYNTPDAPATNGDGGSDARRPSRRERRRARARA